MTSKSAKSAKSSGRTHAATAVPRGPQGAAAAVDVEGLVQRNGDTVKALMQANEAFFSGMAEVGRELMEFGSARLRQDLETTESILQCKDPEQAFRIQYEFAQRATEQYLEEANKLIALTARLAQGYWTPLQERTRESLDELDGE